MPTYLLFTSDFSANLFFLYLVLATSGPMLVPVFLFLVHSLFMSLLSRSLAFDFLEFL